MKTEDGPVAGVANGSILEFLGIPYAAPPVGQLRWQPPQPAKVWTGLRPTNTFAPHCPQIASPFGQASTTEDCLYLNVYTPNGRGKNKDHDPKRGHAKPAKQKKQAYPVMVWIHGGSFQVGESDDYNPARLVKQNMVVVTFNYRLGMLGFLAHPALSAAASTSASGDYGLMDQQAALAWVQRNIARFGGDPDNVTIFGESAGGLSVLAQLASPTAKNLFQKAIVESGSYSLSQPALSQAEAEGDAFAKRAGCIDGSLQCLRNLSVPQIMRAQGNSPEGFLPNTGTTLLPHSILTALSSGQFNQVPVIEGTNQDEWRLFVALEQDLNGKALEASQYLPAIAATLDAPVSAVQKVAEEYPLADYSSPDLALAAVGTDAVFACNAYAETQLLSQYVPTHAYEFSDPDAPEPYLPPVSFPYRSAHMSEVQYLFDLPGQMPPLTSAQKQLSMKMIKDWTQFARSGTPNAGFGQSTFWPSYWTSPGQYLALKPPTTVTFANFPDEHHCAFWSQF